MRLVGRICPHCKQFVAAGEKHACMSADQQRRREVYDSSRWRSFTRPTVLSRDGHKCVLCGAVGELIVDHSPVPLLALLDLGRDPFDPAACRTLCPICSGKEDGPRATAPRMLPTG